MTTKVKLPRVATATANLAAERLQALRELVPEAFSEGRLDVEKLRAGLGDVSDVGSERYSFTWAGKRDAIRLLQLPSRATLVPCPKESVDWDTTQNLFIKGDNLEVLKLLYRSYAGRVKLIFIDPPYNTGNDFIYPDNFADPLDTYLELTHQKNGSGDLLTSNPETAGRYHSAWLSMMYPRLFVARQLLRDDGLIFVSIDDHELHNLRMLMNEVFGEENFVTQIEWQKRYTRSNNTDDFTSVIDHILLYRRSELGIPRLLPREETADARYDNPDNDPRGPWKSIPFLNPLSPEERPNLAYAIVHPVSGEVLRPKKKAWRSSKVVFDRFVAENRVWWGKDGTARAPNIKRFLSEVRPGMTPINFWDHKFAGHTDDANAEIKELFGDKVFDTPKPVQLIKRMLELGTDAAEEAIVLDFFAGSCSTAVAVAEQNAADGGSRRFIVVQIQQPIPETSPAHKAGLRDLAQLGRERIRRALKKLRQVSAETPLLTGTSEGRDIGFRVFCLDESSFRQWSDIPSPDAQAAIEQLEMFSDPLLPGWESDRVLYEVLLKEGYSLSSAVCPLPKTTTGANTVYLVSEPERQQKLLICLDDQIDVSIARLLSLGSEDRFICRDVALTDELACNLALQCRLKTI